MISAKEKPHKILTAKMMLGIIESWFDWKSTSAFFNVSRPFIQTALRKIIKEHHGSYLSKFLVETIWYMSEREITRHHPTPVGSTYHHQHRILAWKSNLNPVRCPSTIYRKWNKPQDETWKSQLRTNNSVSSNDDMWGEGEALSWTVSPIKSYIEVPTPSTSDYYYHWR